MSVAFAYSPLNIKMPEMPEQDARAGRCGLAPQNLILFKTKIVRFSIPCSTLPSKKIVTKLTF